MEASRCEKTQQRKEAILSKREQNQKDKERAKKEDEEAAKLENNGDPRVFLMCSAPLNMVPHLQSISRKCNALCAMPSTSWTSTRTMWCVLDDSTRMRDVSNCSPVHELHAIQVGVDELGVVLARLGMKLNKQQATSTCASLLRSIVFGESAHEALFQVNEMLWESNSDVRMAMSWKAFQEMYIRCIDDKTGLEPKNLFHVIEFLMHDEGERELSSSL